MSITVKTGVMPVSPLDGADIPELVPDSATTSRQATPQLITPGDVAACPTGQPKESTAHTDAEPESEEEEFDDWGLTELVWRDCKSVKLSYAVIF